MIRGHRLNSDDVLAWMQHDSDGTKKVWSITDVERLMQTSRHYARLALEDMTKRGWLVESRETMKNGQTMRAWSMSDTCPRTERPDGVSPGAQADHDYRVWTQERRDRVAARQQELRDKWFLCEKPLVRSVVTFPLTADSRLALPGRGGRILKPRRLVFTIYDGEVSLDIRGIVTFTDVAAEHHDIMLNDYFSDDDRSRFLERAGEILEEWEESVAATDTATNAHDLGEPWVLR